MATAKMKIILPLVVWIWLHFVTTVQSYDRIGHGRREIFFLNLEDGYFGCQVNESTDVLQLFELSKLCDGRPNCYLGSDEKRQELKCTDNCQKEDGSICQNGACLDGQCHCNDGYGGCNCEVPDENECKYRPCDVFAHCTNTLGSFSCTCYPGYQGDGFHCEDINECEDPNIAARCVENAWCCNLPAHFLCKCNPGFQGDGEVQCVDIDECAQPNVCGQNALCRNFPGNYTCECPEGFFGNPYDGCVDVDECDLPGACGPGAYCSNVVGGRQCSCPPGYEGDAYTTGCVDIDECSRSNPCGRDALCSNQEGSFRCSCPPGFIGDPLTGCTEAECNSDLECSNEKACINFQCIDPCTLRGACGLNALCKTIMHRPRCSCPECYVGMANTQCNPDPKCLETHPRPSIPIVCNSDKDCAQNSTCNVGTGECIDPCSNPSFKCRGNKKCEVHNHRPTCVCKNGFVVNEKGEISCAPEKTECSIDDHCPSNKSCIEGICQNPCNAATPPCPPEKGCDVLNHKPICICLKNCIPTLSICLRDNGCPRNQACRAFRCEDPCATANCPENSPCTVEDHKPICEFCPEGFIRDSKYGCLKATDEKIGKCTTDKDCEPAELCFDHKCTTSCVRYCAENAICKIENHNVICLCNSGFVGNASVECIPEVPPPTTLLPDFTYPTTITYPTEETTTKITEKFEIVYPITSSSEKTVTVTSLPVNETTEQYITESRTTYSPTEITRHTSPVASTDGQTTVEIVTDEGFGGKTFSDYGLESRTEPLDTFSFEPTLSTLLPHSSHRTESYTDLTSASSETTYKLPVIETEGSIPREITDFTSPSETTTQYSEIKTENTAETVYSQTTSSSVTSGWDIISTEAETTTSSIPSSTTMNVPITYRGKTEKTEETEITTSLSTEKSTKTESHMIPSRTTTQISITETGVTAETVYEETTPRYLTSEKGLTETQSTTHSISTQPITITTSTESTPQTSYIPSTSHLSTSTAELTSTERLTTSTVPSIPVTQTEIPIIETESTVETVNLPSSTSAGEPISFEEVTKIGSTASSITTNTMSSILTTDNETTGHPESTSYTLTSASELTSIEQSTQTGSTLSSRTSETIYPQSSTSTEKVAESSAVATEGTTTKAEYPEVTSNTLTSTISSTSTERITKLESTIPSFPSGTTVQVPINDTEDTSKKISAGTTTYSPTSSEEMTSKGGYIDIGSTISTESFTQQLTTEPKRTSETLVSETGMYTSTSAIELTSIEEVTETVSGPSGITIQTSTDETESSVSSLYPEVTTAEGLVSEVTSFHSSLTEETTSKRGVTEAMYTTGKPITETKGTTGATIIGSTSSEAAQTESSSFSISEKTTTPLMLNETEATITTGYPDVSTSSRSTTGEPTSKTETTSSLSTSTLEMTSTEGVTKSDFSTTSFPSETTVQVSEGTYMTSPESTTSKVEITSMEEVAETPSSSITKTSYTRATTEKEIMTYSSTSVGNLTTIEVTETGYTIPSSELPQTPQESVNNTEGTARTLYPETTTQQSSSTFQLTSKEGLTETLSSITSKLTTTTASVHPDITTPANETELATSSKSFTLTIPTSITETEATSKATYPEVTTHLSTSETEMTSMKEGSTISSIATESTEAQITETFPTTKMTSIEVTRGTGYTTAPIPSRSSTVEVETESISMISYPGTTPHISSSSLEMTSTKEVTEMGSSLSPLTESSVRSTEGVTATVSTISPSSTHVYTSASEVTDMADMGSTITSASSPSPSAETEATASTMYASTPAEEKMKSTEDTLETESTFSSIPTGSTTPKPKTEAESTLRTIYPEVSTHLSTSTVEMIETKGISQTDYAETTSKISTVHNSFFN